MRVDDCDSPGRIPRPGNYFASSTAMDTNTSYLGIRLPHPCVLRKSESGSAHFASPDRERTQGTVVACANGKDMPASYGVSDGIDTPPDSADM